MTIQDKISTINAIIGALNLLVLAGTGLIVWLYTKAAQRSNEIQEEPLLNVYFEDLSSGGTSRMGRLSIKNIGKGPAYNISIEKTTLKGYQYNLYTEDRLLEAQKESRIEMIVNTPKGGTEGGDTNLMWFITRLMPDVINKETVESHRQNPTFFILKYQGSNGKNYYSCFGLYCAVPPVGEIYMQFISRGEGSFSKEKAQELWSKTKRMRSPFER